MLGIFRRHTNEFKKMKAALLHKHPLCSADLRQDVVRGLVSVVLPVYNGEKYLREAIDSVLSQTYTRLELIIVDDGSTDESGRIADEFIKKDDRVKVIHQKNMKLPTALNDGFAAARGEFLTWTSADNRMMPVCLEILAAELSRDRACDMVYGNMRLIDEDGDILRGKGWYEMPLMSGNVILPDSTDKLNIVANNTIGAAFMYRSGTLGVLGGYAEDKYLLEDYDWFMRMNSFFSIKHTICKKPIYEYRMHSGSLTAQDEELGITASRPALMELDKKRRAFYQKQLCFYLDGDDKEVEAALAQGGRRIYSTAAADGVAKRSPARIFYVNCGNTAPTWEVPKGVPRFLVSVGAQEGAFGYDVRICKDASAMKGFRDWICPTTTTTLASFIHLRAKNDMGM